MIIVTFKDKARQQFQHICPKERVDGKKSRGSKVSICPHLSVSPFGGLTYRENNNERQ